MYKRGILIGPPSRFERVAARMGVELARELDVSDFWLKNLQKSKLSEKQSYDALFDTGILNTPRYVMKIDGMISSIPENSADIQ